MHFIDQISDDQLNAYINDYYVFLADDYLRGPSESYSRSLDNRVAAQEMPYGYSTPPPPADTGDYDEKSHESKKEYRPRRHG